MNDKMQDDEQNLFCFIHQQIVKWLRIQSLLTADLNVSEVLFSVHVIVDDKVSVNECPIAAWTFSLLLHCWRERDACLTKGNDTTLYVKRRNRNQDHPENN